MIPGLVEKDPEVLGGTPVFMGASVPVKISHSPRGRIVLDDAFWSQELDITPRVAIAIIHRS